MDIYINSSTMIEKNNAIIHQEEKDRIDRYKDKSLMPFTHHHYCETLESTNYYEYISNYTKRGQEYQVSILTSTGGNGYNILKIEKYSSSIENNIKKFKKWTAYNFKSFTI